MKLITMFTGWVNKNKATVIIFIISLIFAALSYFQFQASQKLRKQLDVANQNIVALNDTIRITKDRNKEDEYNRYALLTDKLSNLEKLNSDLATEVKSIKGKVASIVSAEVKIVEKPVPFIVKGELIDSIVRADFKYDTIYSPGNFRNLKGYTKYDLRTGVVSGEKTVDEIGIKFRTGIKNLDKGKPEIFLASQYPGFTVTELDGAVLDPKLFQKKKVKLITTGINIGWTPVTYDVFNKRWDTNLGRLGITGGININLVKLLQKK
jgi:hypothetical protein